MKVKCLFFAGAKDIVGKSPIEFEINEGTTTTNFKKILLAQHPSLEKILTTSLLAVNQEYVETSVVLKDGDEIAVIPPISGG